MRAPVARFLRAGVRFFGTSSLLVSMEPVAVLIVLPTLVGVAAALCFHDARSASLAGALASVLAVSLAVSLLGGMDHWSWLAAFMVSPLTVGCAVAAVVICQGRLREHHRKPRREA